MAVTSLSQSGINNYIRFNSLNDASEFAAAGGSVSESGGYRIHTFQASGEFVVISGIKKVDIFRVAGGGGGGNSAGSGGGGGEVIETETLAGVGVGTYLVTVGAGGSTASDGTDSSALSLVGQKGLRGDNQGGSSQSGGTSGDGFSGGNAGRAYAGGGGGGGTASGGDGRITYSGRNGTSRGGNGGAGKTSSFSGASILYSGGGGGRAVTGPYSFDGVNRSVQGNAAGGQVANRGGGGQGNGPGWSGVVIIRYAI